MLVAEPVTRTQRAKILKEQATCDDEWTKLFKRETWDPHSVKEWDFVASRSRDIGVKVHVAMLLKFVLLRALSLRIQTHRRSTKGELS